MFLVCPVSVLLYGAPALERAHMIHVPMHRWVGLVKDEPVVVALAGAGRNNASAILTSVFGGKEQGLVPVVSNVPPIYPF
jgi:hypothetical protein